MNMTTAMRLRIAYSMSYFAIGLPYRFSSWGWKHQINNEIVSVPTLIIQLSQFSHKRHTDVTSWMSCQLQWGENHLKSFILSC